MRRPCPGCGTETKSVTILGSQVRVTVDAEPDPDGRYATRADRRRYGLHERWSGYLITDMHPLRQPYVAHRKHNHRRSA